MAAQSTPFPTSSSETRSPEFDPSSANGMPGMDTPTLPDGADGLIDRVAQSAHHTIDRLAETAAPHVNRLQESLAGAGDTLHARADQVRETGDEWAESLRSTVRENPLAAVGVALAVGVLIARLSR
jgi:ElaB/YqjD/DUF883 family membrane-anchored ribosome-binding protein